MLVVVAAAAIVRKRQPHGYTVRIKHCRTLLAVTSGGRSGIWRSGRRSRRLSSPFFYPSRLPPFILEHRAYIYTGISPGPPISFILCTVSALHSSTLFLKSFARHSFPRIIGHKSNVEAPSFLLYPYSVSWPNIKLTFGLFDIK